MLTQERPLIYKHIRADEAYQFTCRLVECGMLPVDYTGDERRGQIDDFDARRFSKVLSPMNE